MGKTKWKADEMEMTINFKSIRIAYVFSILALFGYCIYILITENELPLIPFIIFCGELCLFYLTKLCLTKKITRGSRDEEHN
jgi:hypothetical protein